MKRIYVTVLIAAGIAVISTLAIHYFDLSKGDTAPDFTLTELSGKTIQLGTYRGKYVLLHFWAPWCNICLRELGSLERLNQKFKDSGLEIISVVEDEIPPADIKHFFKITFPVLLDLKGEVADTYMVYQVPQTFLISREGIILERFDGFVEWDSFEKMAYFMELFDERD